MLSVLQSNNHSFQWSILTSERACIGCSMPSGKLCNSRTYFCGRTVTFESGRKMVNAESWCCIKVRKSQFSKVIIFLTFLQPSRTIGQAPNTNRYLVRMDGSNRHFFPTMGAPDRRVCLVPILSLVTRKVTSIAHRTHE